MHTKSLIVTVLALSLLCVWLMTSGQTGTPTVMFETKQVGETTAVIPASTGQAVERQEHAGPERGPEDARGPSVDRSRSDPRPDPWLVRFLVVDELDAPIADAFLGQGVDEPFLRLHSDASGHIAVNRALKSDAGSISASI